MKILLIGEYSGVHTALAHELAKAGHQVTTVSNGDAYKNLPANILIRKRRPAWRSLRYLSVFWNLIGLAGIGTYLRYRKKLRGLSENDVVQLINPVAVPELGAIGNILLVRLLKKKSNSIFLCALGDDYTWVNACLAKRFSYSPLDGLNICNPVSLARYSYSVKYILSPLYRVLDLYVKKSCVQVIPGLIDYSLAYERCPKSSAVISLPVPLASFHSPTRTGDRIKIFHGWQKGKERRKGNDILDAAVQRVLAQYGPSNVEYVVAQGMTYEEYIKSYRDCDIYLDQVYSYDRGMAGALGMCAGKVVFSGFEGHPPADFDSRQVCSDITVIGVNATPNVEQIFTCLAFLIENKCYIDQIKRSAYEYALEHYKADTVAAGYYRLWCGAGFLGRSQKLEM